MELMKKTVVIFIVISMVMLAFAGCPEPKPEPLKIDPKLVGYYFDEMRRQQINQTTLLYFYDPIMNSTAKCYFFTETTIVIGTYIINSITTVSTTTAYSKNGNIYSSANDSLILSYEIVTASFCDAEWQAANSAQNSGAIVQVGLNRTAAQNGRIIKFTSAGGGGGPTFFSRRL